MRFDGNPREHLHITSSHCGSVEDANIEPSDDILENLENILGKLTKYGVFGHKLELMGFCGSCTKRENIPA